VYKSISLHSLPLGKNLQKGSGHINLLKLAYIMVEKQITFCIYRSKVLFVQKTGQDLFEISLE